MSKKKLTPKKLTGRTFDALSADEKERIYSEIDAADPDESWAQCRPPTKPERKRLDRIARKVGRPTVGKGSKVVSISVESELLHTADKFARARGMGRTELFVFALKSVLGKAS